jgi:hypothetical protein
MDPLHLTRAGFGSAAIPQGLGTGPTCRTSQSRACDRQGLKSVFEGLYHCVFFFVFVFIGLGNWNASWKLRFEKQQKVFAHKVLGSNTRTIERTSMDEVHLRSFSVKCRLLPKIQLATEASSHYPKTQTHPALQEIFTIHCEICQAFNRGPTHIVIRILQ